MLLYGLKTFEVKKGTVVAATTLGYFTKTKLKELEEIVLNNTTDIHETIYNYAVIYKVPTNQLYAFCYTSIYKAYKAVVPQKPYKYNDVTYEEIDKSKLPLEVRQYFTDLAIEEIIPEED